MVRPSSKTCSKAQLLAWAQALPDNAFVYAYEGEGGAWICAYVDALPFAEPIPVLSANSPS